MIPDIAVEEFRKLYQEQFGISLGQKQAKEKADSTLLMFKAIFKPAHKDKRYPNIQNTNHGK